MDAAELTQGWMHCNCGDTYSYSVYLQRRISEAWRDFRMPNKPVASFCVISPFDRTCLRACWNVILLGWRMRAMLGHVVLIVATTWGPTVRRTILMPLRAC